MARAIYREWFVHFRYPGHEDATLVDSPLGPIPDGWTVRPLGDVLEASRRMGRPRRRKRTRRGGPAASPSGARASVDRLDDEKVHCDGQRSLSGRDRAAMSVASRWIRRSVDWSSRTARRTTFADRSCTSDRMSSSSLIAPSGFDDTHSVPSRGLQPRYAGRSCHRVPFVVLDRTASSISPPRLIRSGTAAHARRAG